MAGGQKKRPCETKSCTAAVSDYTCDFHLADILFTTIPAKHPWGHWSGRGIRQLVWLAQLVSAEEIHALNSRTRYCGFVLVVNPEAIQVAE